MTAIVLLAPSTVSQKHAARLSADLSALGVRVGRSDGRRIANADLEAADKVVLLWTKGSPRGSALRATARRARAEGKLILAQLDGGKPPKDIGRAVAAPRGRNAARAWLKLIGAPANAVVTPAAPAKKPANEQASAIKPVVSETPQKGGGALVAIMLGAVVIVAAGAAAYLLVPGVAGSVSAAFGGQ